MLAAVLWDGSMLASQDAHLDRVFGLLQATVGPLKASAQPRIVCLHLLLEARQCFVLALPCLQLQTALSQTQTAWSQTQTKTLLAAGDAEVRCMMLSSHMPSVLECRQGTVNILTHKMYIKEQYRSEERQDIRKKAL